MATAALSYEESGIETILIQSSFLLLLNGINWILDKAIYCGLIGQIFVGVAWGTPGGKLLALEIEETVMQLGYLGLILIVYEGGLSTSFKALRSNIYLSGSVALIGIATPISLSFILLKLLNATPVQAFAAGAALCSTSLGTTFTILSTSGLDKSRLGVILSSAAMLDDVAGLVMVQVISNLGASSDSFSAITVIRPVFVSIAFAVIVPAVCWFVVKPLTKFALSGPSKLKADHWITTPITAFLTHTLLLIGLVTGSTYAGTSNLFAAYIAGAVVSWWDDLVHTTKQEDVASMSQQQTPAQSGDVMDNHRSSSGASSPTPPSGKHTPMVPTEPTSHTGLTGIAIYEACYAPAVSRILQPFFFASIGFSIPITLMFKASIVWKGIVYTLLMILAKLVCGFVLVRFTTSDTAKVQLPARVITSTSASASPSLDGRSTGQASEEPNNHVNTNANASSDEPVNETTNETTNGTRPTTTTSKANTPLKRHSPRKIPKPQSLYPSLMLGSAMVARGEIGFLISSLAESKGVFKNSTDASSGEESSEIFLVATWAILLCTIVGPVAVGVMVKRVRALQKRGKKGDVGGVRGRGDPLGGWGVEG